jgi:hypothetical protein
MVRIAPLTSDDARKLSRPEIDRQIRAHRRTTNVKRTPAHSASALRACAEWYPRRDEVAGLLGDRTTTNVISLRIIPAAGHYR